MRNIGIYPPNKKFYMFLKCILTLFLLFSIFLYYLGNISILKLVEISFILSIFFILSYKVNYLKYDDKYIYLSNSIKEKIYERDKMEYFKAQYLFLDIYKIKFTNDSNSHIVALTVGLFIFEFENKKVANEIEKELLS